MIACGREDRALRPALCRHRGGRGGARLGRIGGRADDAEGAAGAAATVLGTAVAGEGGLTAAVDAYGDVVDLRAPGPAGATLIDNPADRQAAGTVPVKTGIVPRVTVGDSPPLPLWRAEVVSQHYLRDSNVVETRAIVREARLIVRTAATGDTLAMQLIPRSSRQGRALPAVSVNVTGGIHCAHEERAGVLDLLCRVGRALPPVQAATRGGSSVCMTGPCTGRSGRRADGRGRRGISVPARRSGHGRCTGARC